MQLPLFVQTQQDFATPHSRSLCLGKKETEVSHIRVCVVCIVCNDVYLSSEGCRYLLPRVDIQTRYQMIAFPPIFAINEN
jgi:hypothetical protein